MQNNSEFQWENFTYGIGSAIQEAANKFSIEKPEELCSFLMERISFHCGGSNIYIPMGLSLSVRKNARNSLIIKEFNGSNQAYLANKYGISLQWVYKILKTQGRKK